MMISLRLFVIIAVLSQLSHGFAPTRFSAFNRPQLNLKAHSNHDVRMTYNIQQTFSKFAPEGTKRSKVVNFLSKSGKVLLPIGIQLGLMLFLGVSPSFAASRGSRRKAGAAAAAVAVASKPPPLWKKILEGANVTGSFKKWKPGDTRSEFATIVNAATTLIIMGGLFFVASLYQLNVQRIEEQNLKKEVVRVKEYKENMYFDAVDEILKKLSDPAVKSSTKSNLTKQLKDLDPDGVIAQYVLKGGERPDISYLLGRKTKKSKSGKSSSSTASSSTKKTPPTTKKPVVKETYKDDDEEEDDNRSAFSTSNNNNNNNNNNISDKKNNGSSKSNDQDDDDDNNSSNIPKSKDLASSVVYKQVLSELEESLEGKLPAWKRSKLITYLKTRIESTVDSTKRGGIVSKIAERLGATEYWVDYANKLSS